MDASFATLNISRSGWDFPPRHPSLIGTPRPPPRRLLGFLDFPSKVRNHIYELLLVNRSPETGELHIVNIVDSPQKRRNGYGAFSRYILGGNGKGGLVGEDQPSSKNPKNSCDYIYPEILRDIAEEVLRSCTATTSSP